jgi:hypothetical protein
MTMFDAGRPGRAAATRFAMASSPSFGSFSYAANMPCVSTVAIATAVPVVVSWITTARAAMWSPSNWPVLPRPITASGIRLPSPRPLPPRLITPKPIGLMSLTAAPTL